MSISKKKVVSAKINRVTVGGVYYRKDKNRYIARFTLNGKRINVGSFMTERKAKTALTLARRTALSA